ATGRYLRLPAASLARASVRQTRWGQAADPGGSGKRRRSCQPTPGGPLGLGSRPVDRSQILAEIRRTAEANGGTALGRNRFAAETGIRESDWSGRYWTRWNDALVEAGYPPNRLQERHDDEKLLAALIDEIRRHGRTPTMAELKLRRHQDDT